MNTINIKHIMDRDIVKGYSLSTFLLMAILFLSIMIICKLAVLLGWVHGIDQKIDNIQTSLDEGFTIEVIE